MGATRAGYELHAQCRPDAPGGSRDGRSGAGADPRCQLQLRAGRHVEGSWVLSCSLRLRTTDADHRRASGDLHRRCAGSAARVQASPGDVLCPVRGWLRCCGRGALHAHCDRWTAAGEHRQSCAPGGGSSSIEYPRASRGRPGDRIRDVLRGHPFRLLVRPPWGGCSRGVGRLALGRRGVDRGRHPRADRRLGPDAGRPPRNRADGGDAHAGPGWRRPRDGGGGDHATVPAGSQSAVLRLCGCVPRRGRCPRDRHARPPGSDPGPDAAPTRESRAASGRSGSDAVREPLLLHDDGPAVHLRPGAHRGGAGHGPGTVERGGGSDRFGPCGSTLGDHSGGLGPDDRCGGHAAVQRGDRSAQSTVAGGGDRVRLRRGGRRWRCGSDECRDGRRSTRQGRRGVGIPGCCGQHRHGCRGCRHDSHRHHGSVGVAAPPVRTGRHRRLPVHAGRP